MALSISQASAAVGCLVEGLDLATAGDDAIAECRELLFAHGALFFRGQNLSPRQQIDFAARMGKIVINRFFTPVPGFPEIAQVTTEPDQDWVIGENWHTDHSYDDAPALGSILYAVETPPVGGDTCFAGMQAAYDALDLATKERLEGLTALHESAHIFAPSEAQRLAQAEDRLDTDYISRADVYPSAAHPVVIAHPETGRRGLFVNPEFTTAIVGMEKGESDALLRTLFDHCLQPRFLFRFRWAPGSLAIWDNRSTWHRAMNDYRGHRRQMRRITLAGRPLS